MYTNAPWGSFTINCKSRKVMTVHARSPYIENTPTHTQRMHTRSISVTSGPDGVKATLRGAQLHIISFTLAIFFSYVFIYFSSFFQTLYLLCLCFVLAKAEASRKFNSVWRTGGLSAWRATRRVIFFFVPLVVLYLFRIHLFLPFILKHTKIKLKKKKKYKCFSSSTSVGWGLYTFLV